MKRYLLTSPKLNGSMELVYKSNGMLAKIDMLQAETNYEQLDVMIKQLPYHFEDLDKLPKTIKVTRVDFDVEFDDFYKNYKPKHNADRCKALWAKMSNADQILAAMGVKEYQRACVRIPRKPADPEKYLKEKYYLTNWKEM